MNKICIVSLFYDIGRGEWQNIFNRKFDQYLECFMPYIDLFKQDIVDKTNNFNLENRYEMILYIDSRYYDKTKAAIPADLPIQLVSINERFLNDNIPTWSKLTREAEIMNSDQYKTRFAHRLQYPENSNPKYTLINIAKLDFIAHTIVNNLSSINANYFCWGDFGYFKLPQWIPKRLIDPSKLDTTRINYVTVNPLDNNDRDVIYTMNNAPERIDGGFIFGHKTLMLKYQKLIHNIHDWFQVNDLADDDQHHALRCYFARPDMFNLINTGPNSWHIFFTFAEKKE